jgi:hypothetical protein
MGAKHRSLAIDACTVEAIGVSAPLRVDRRDVYGPVAASLENFKPTTRHQELDGRRADAPRWLFAGRHQRDREHHQVSEPEQDACGIVEQLKRLLVARPEICEDR